MRHPKPEPIDIDFSILFSRWGQNILKSQRISCSLRAAIIRLRVLIFKSVGHLSIIIILDE